MCAKERKQTASKSVVDSIMSELPDYSLQELPEFAKYAEDPPDPETAKRIFRMNKEMARRRSMSHRNDYKGPIVGYANVRCDALLDRALMKRIANGKTGERNKADIAESALRRYLKDEIREAREELGLDA